MGLDLDFWKYKEGVYLDNKEVSLKARGGEEIDGLEQLPLADILEEVAAVFFGWNAPGPDRYEKKGRGSFSIFTTAQFVRFDCCGMSCDDMNLLMDVMFHFDCPLYDPQISMRFDAE